MQIKDDIGIGRKYRFPIENTSSLLGFKQKLQEKKQNRRQQEEAEHAIRLYYELQDNASPGKISELRKEGRPGLSAPTNMDVFLPRQQSLISSQKPSVQQRRSEDFGFFLSSCFIEGVWEN